VDILDVTTGKEKTTFVDFAYEVYRDTPAYRDNLGYTGKNFVYQRDSFSRRCRIKLVLARENGAVAARCAYIAHPGFDAAQIALFEALPDKREAVDLIMDAGRAFAAENKLNRILIGVNGHTSYGVGFLSDHFDEPNPFDSVYTQPYYPGYFRERGFKEHGVSAYYVQTSRFHADKDILSRIRNRFAFRNADLRDLRAEMNILGALFNETLKDTPFFFPRPAVEWYEVFKELRPILRNENILYVLKDGKEVGFLFWHPNYNMVLRGNGRNSAPGFFLKYMLGRRNISEMKINALGMLPEYRRSGAVLGLFNELYSAIRGKYSGGETGFVFDSNASSAAVCRRFCGPAFRRYVLFETAVGS
jgi:hypothetical protein